jgi:hypothetical protein
MALEKNGPTDEKIRIAPSNLGDFPSKGDFS